MPRSALTCALLAGVLAATAVAEQRVGLALSCCLLLCLAAGRLASEHRSSRWTLALCAALALQPMVRDAGWVVAVSCVAALVGAAAAVAAPVSWSALAWNAAAPWRLVAGSALVVRSVAALRQDGAARNARPVARGAALATLLTAAFGWLFAVADPAFAKLTGDAFAIDADPFVITWRVLLGVAFVAAAGALARAGRPLVQGPSPAPRVPGRVELRIGLGALVALFAVFVAVQVRVLFGGARYVQATTGLGYGEYARQGFVALLAVTALTLAVVAVAARRKDAVVRALLGVLCLLAGVVLASSYHRLVLVEDAYGLTRVRYGGHAIAIWLGAVLALVLAAGVRRSVARAAPRIAVALSLVAALAFSLSDPDRRIADRAVDRLAQKGAVDEWYLRSLSADALPALERLPPVARGGVLSEVRGRLKEPDGIAGFNWARARAR
jgi:hypothetical protein